ncbi:hypothetical protein [Pseudanabaena sp. FACHB-2040]|uniref:hypothetical protein n=1 Tax=Pseudanabaena sp. FACHB-2040 TaxID=2692859 RepID=UPI001682EE06|nr:hypothetical protein [Pseudanabaena sp. FACHB-2040]MBD2260405.1 hypothetical protein [Pseudanabaena sp. FACHB-2040]
MTAIIFPQTTTYSYQQAHKSALKVNWRVEDILNGDRRIDFTKRFMPETLARVNDIPFLSSYEKLKLNQIRGNSYLHIFSLVEECIVPTVIDHIHHLGSSDWVAVQALLHFAEEEGKHIRLFRGFAEEFECGFGSRCETIGPVQEIADLVLQHHPLSVILMILYVEWMTQRHYLESVRDNYLETLDVQFCSLLRHHWLEEAQHTALDTLMVEKVAADLDAAGIAAGVEDFFRLIEFLNQGLMTQVQLDIESLTHATGHAYTEAERQTIQAVQERAYRWTFIGSGLVHSHFVKTFSKISPTNCDRLMAIARAHSYAANWGSTADGENGE